MGNCWPNCKLTASKSTTATSAANKNNNDAGSKYKQQQTATATTLINKKASSSTKKHKSLKTTTINGTCNNNNRNLACFSNKNANSMQQHQQQDATTTTVQQMQQQSPQTTRATIGMTTATTNSEQQSQKSILLPRRDIDFKQFCRNSADKLTHKLSFNKSKSPQQATSSNHEICIINENKINVLFDKYKDSSDTKSILTEGVQQLCDDLNLKNDDFKLLLFAWKFNLKTMCKITKDEFINGFKVLVKIDNLKDLYQKLVQINEDINKDRNEFRNLYRWTFDFGLDKDAGERTLPLDIAITLWEIVYKNEHEPAILSNWLKFLNDNPQIKGIPRDTWFMFPLFASSVGQFNYNLYDDNEAWPCLFDEFVQHEIANNENTIKLELKQQQQQNESECEHIN